MSARLRSRRARRTCGTVVALASTFALAASACGGDPPRPTLEQTTTVTGSPPKQGVQATAEQGATGTTAAPAGSSSTTTLPARPAAPNGRTAPSPARTPTGLAAQLVAAERAVRSSATAAAALPDLAHQQQLAYRILSSKPEWDVEALAAVPDDLKQAVRDNLAARRAFFEIKNEFPAANMPAWKIIPPAPAASLLAWYREAEAATGIPWNVLAAVNFVETSFGRIKGLSSAGARGPMQFMPSTWAESGIGKGDIEDPHDSIQAAARYLVRRGGPADMRKALFGYNNSNAYVNGVLAYAELMKDERAFLGYYNWEVYFGSARGGLWLPVGVYDQPTTITIDDYIASAPWSLTPQF